MPNDASIDLDVAVVGGGPAGISACLELAGSPDLNVALFEGDRELGGMPRTCHVFFGMRDQMRLLTGPAYARRLKRLVEGTGCDIHRSARVLDIFPGKEGEPHGLRVLSPEGPRDYACRSLLLATGCFEGGRAERQIPGARPAGVLTTGTLQQVVNQRDRRPGSRALIIGTENVSFSSVLTLRRAGVSIVGMVEEGPELQTYPFAGLIGIPMGFPIFKGTTVGRILGDRRVEAVDLVRVADGTARRVECDTVVMTGRFRPDSVLMDNTAIEFDPASRGPVVDMDFRTSVQNIFAAGNILRGADMHDLCALEGRLAGRGIARSLGSGGTAGQRGIRIRGLPPIRYVVPQRLIPERIKRSLLSQLIPWPSFQVERTLGLAVLEARSGEALLWSGAFRRIIANTRIPLPVEKFDWDGVDAEKGIVLQIRSVHESSIHRRD
ncbi:MAG: FAD-dependent oxidoreductase [Deltaproteobacteria bacterium]|nr:FAD-dependent oxidoreductase [Deltaproteobacteria bacterium]